MVLFGDAFLLVFNLRVEQLQKRQVLAQQRAVGFWQLEPTEPAAPFHSKEITALRQLQALLPIQQCVDAVADGSAQPGKIESLP